MFGGCDKPIVSSRNGLGGNSFTCRIWKDEETRSRLRTHSDCRLATGATSRRCELEHRLAQAGKIFGSISLASRLRGLRESSDLAALNHQRGSVPDL